MFSFPMGRGLPSADYQYDLVDTQRGSPQGRLFPSDVVQAHPFTPATNATVEPWYCEGDLTTATTARIGAAATIDAFVKHRTTYWSEQDLVTMASHGVNTVRLNVGWWAFHSFPLPAEESIITDPCYGNKTFVTLSEGFLTMWMDRFAAHGIQVLFDLHAMPCGSADGTYNGVFPQKPLFFENATAQSIGLQVIDNMLSWYNALNPARRAAVYGFTLLNEPGHLMVPGMIPTAAPIVSWLRDAVALYEKKVVTGVESPPMLLMNLIGTAFNYPACSDQVACMVNVTAVDLDLAHKDWAVFDVHHYFAWDGGSGIPMQNCSTAAALRSYVDVGMTSYMTEIVTKGNKVGLYNFATSEWSLCTHRNDSQACQAPDSQTIMHEGQREAFRKEGFANFFWGWNMPYGGWHEAKWSLKHFLTGAHGAREGW